MKGVAGVRRTFKKIGQASRIIQRVDAEQLEDIFGVRLEFQPMLYGGDLDVIYRRLDGSVNSLRIRCNGAAGHDASIFSTPAA